MWRPSNVQWWILFAVTLFVIVAWPPQENRSLATKFVNWAVDPSDQLPILPSPLPLGVGDDPDAVNAHDDQVRRYDALSMKGGWTRKRLELKVADDPFDPTTTRQLLVGLFALAALVVWRVDAARK